MSAPPRQIYASSLSRRERVWGTSRRRRGRFMARLSLLGLAFLVAAASTTVAAVVFGHLLA